MLSKDDLKALVSKGLTRKEISVETGVPYVTIYRLTIKYGFQMDHDCKSRTLSLEKAKLLIAEGKSLRDLSKVFGLSHNGVRKWLDRNGLKTVPKIIPHTKGGRNRSWTDEALIVAVKNNTTYSGVRRELGYIANNSGNTITIKKYIKKLGLDISHFNGSTQQHGGRRRPKPEDILVKDSTYFHTSLKRLLLTQKLIPNICAICGMLPSWKGEPLVLVMDHINGVSDDNRIENLRFLCPNCNSQTPTFAGRNKKKKAPVIAIFN